MVCARRSAVSAPYAMTATPGDPATGLPECRGLILAERRQPKAGLGRIVATDYAAAGMSSTEMSFPFDRRISMRTIPSLALAFLILPLSTLRAEVPDAIAAPGETLVATIHAEGAQVYERKADASGKLAWQLREPIATLLLDGRTVGRHYAGPNWELADGSAVVAKVAARAPGATAKDIPLLKLEVVSQRGSGQLTGVTTIQRLATK